MHDLSLPSPAYPAIRPDVRAVPLRGGRWRVTRDRGEGLGYVDLVDTADTLGGRGGPRYRSTRMLPRDTRVMVLGEYADPADALESVSVVSSVVRSRTRT